jgi:hypothetical protein
MSFEIRSLILTLSAGLSFAASARDARKNLLVGDGGEIFQISDKIPALITVLAKADTANWHCTDIDVADYCSDVDGCTINLHLQHKIDGNDLVRGIKEYLYFENPAFSNNRKPSLNGYTRQSAGGEHGWETGGAGQYTLFAPWGWIGAYNYRPAQCPGQAGRNSPAHANPYLITIASHPHVNAVVSLED